MTPKAQRDPCGPWSPLQNLNDASAVEFKRSLHMPFWEFCARVWAKQHRAGRLVLLDCVRNREHVLRAVVDQCRFGLCDPVNQRLYRKPAALDVNSEVFAVALMKDALRNHGAHQHQPIEGQSRLDGKSGEPLSGSRHMDEGRSSDLCG